MEPSGRSMTIPRSYISLFTVTKAVISIPTGPLAACLPVARAPVLASASNEPKRTVFCYNLSSQLCQYTLARERDGGRRIHLGVPEGGDANCAGVFARPRDQFVSILWYKILHSPHRRQYLQVSTLRKETTWGNVTFLPPDMLT